MGIYLQIKMQVDTGADSTVISSKIWTDFGKPQLDGKIRHLEAYDGHKLTLLGSVTGDVEWNGSRLTQKQIAVVQSDKEFELLGRDLLPKHGVSNITAEHLPAVNCCEGLQSSCEADTRNTANVLQSQKNTSTSSRQGHREVGTDGQTGHPWTGTSRRCH